MGFSASRKQRLAARDTALKTRSASGTLIGVGASSFVFSFHWILSIVGRKLPLPGTPTFVGLEYNRISQENVN
jgi:hypothetical protein